MDIGTRWTSSWPLCKSEYLESGGQEAREKNSKSLAPCIHKEASEVVYECVVVLFLIFFY
jgi:hypothetical protein